MNYDIIVIGSGPAGISAAIYAKRSNVNVVIISKKDTTLYKADKIDNYYGFATTISGEELYENGLKQAENLGIEIIEDEVVGINYDGNYSIDGINGSYTAKAVIMATGSKKAKTPIKGADDFLGKGLSYCAICDGFFYRKKKVGVFGSGEYALHEAKVLSNICSEVIIYTNGENTNITEFTINSKKIVSLQGEEKLEALVFEDGTKEELDGLFVAIGSAGTTDLALKLGAIVENNKVVINSKMETNMPGFYACGDATGGLLQISKAVYEGSMAGLEASKFVKGK